MLNLKMNISLLLVLVLTASLLTAVKAVVPCGQDNMCCNSGESCCRLSNGTLGCFPSENAVCCDGSSFACKKDYYCNIKYGMCLDLDMIALPLSPTHAPKMCKKNIPSSSFISDVREQCGPDGFCNGENRCCPYARPIPACCPFQLGECCSDKLHCCPAGYKCDVARQGCVATNTSFSRIIQKFSRVMDKAPKGTVFCPDHSVCYDNQTCCHLSSGRYGCCPDSKGVCCADGEHCCPYNTVCDVVQQKCIKKHEWANLIDTTSSKQAVIPVKLTVQRNRIVCPDPTYKCPDNTTCCHLNSGAYGCCPYPNAVCCSDGDHCCPSGYTCDSVHQRCVSSRSALEQHSLLRTVNKKVNVVPDWAKEDTKKLTVEHMNLPRKLSHVHRPREIVCPDKSSVCEDGTTCCAMSDGTYGCCPYANATCCADHQHCCPMSYTCDLVHQQCAQASKHVQVPFGVVIIQTFGDEKVPFDDKKESVSNKEEGPFIPFFQDILSFVDNVMNSGLPKFGDAVMEKEPVPDVNVNKQSCSVLEALLMGCPRGTTCCRPVGENQPLVCCPGSGQVSCCPGGFCCPEGHECNPLTLKCHRSTPGFELNV